MTQENIVPLVMPKWGLSMEEGKLSDWLVKEGDTIAVGDEIMEVETDKIANVVEAADGGILRRQVAQAGEVYPVRALLGVLASEDVSDQDIEAFIASYEIPEAEDDDVAAQEPLYEFIETSQGRLRYAVRGDKEAIVILVHGFGGDLDNWLFTMEALTDQATVYALDLPGHGQSVKSLSDPDLSSLSKALTDFMEAMDIKAAHMVGHSMGAGVVAMTALSAPKRVLSLSLISAAGLGPEINEAYIDGFINASSRRELKSVLQNLFADSKLVSRSMVDDLLKYKRLDGVQDTLSKLRDNLFSNGKQCHILTERLSTLSIPVLVLWGAEDRIIPSFHARNLKMATKEVINNAGHMVQMEQASRVNEYILDHMRRVDS